METTVNKHESYGLVVLSRYHSSHGMDFFGSSIQHRNGINITIKRAEHCRTLSNDWYHGNEHLITVNLSPNQFAELITNMNCGDGVPCTIDTVGKTIMEKPPVSDKRVQFRNEFSDDVKKVGENLNALLEKVKVMSESKTVKKSEVNELLMMVKMAKQQIESNIPFVNEQFAEQMDKTVTEAKAEIEAFGTNLILKTGLDVLKGKVPTIASLNDKNSDNGGEQK